MQAVTAHATQSRLWRREGADLIWTPATTAALRVDPNPQTALPPGITPSMLWGRMTYNEELREQVELVLAEECLGKVAGKCGRASGYKAGGRCAECRAAKR